MVQLRMPTPVPLFGLGLILCLLLPLGARSEPEANAKTNELVLTLEKCGFTGREYKLVTADRVILSVVRARNPLFNKGKRRHKAKRPIVFLQGTTLGTALALENWRGVRPRDFSKLDTNKLTREQIMQEVGSDPSARNFFFLALNFGHEVWFVNRRGYEGSRHRVGDQNRTLLDALLAVPESLFDYKHLGGVSSTGGLLLNHRVRAKRVAASGDTSKRSAIDPGLEPMSDQFSAHEWLGNKIISHMNQSSNLDEKFHYLASPLSLLEIPQSLKLFKDVKFKQEFIETFNPSFYNFSIDEQAKYDLVSIVDFVKGKVNSDKVHLVGLSLGGAMILMGLSETPQLADKVGAVILWAPSVNLGSGLDVVFQLSAFVPMFQEYTGPFPPLFLDKPLQMALKYFCTSSNLLRHICRLMYASVFGYSGLEIEHDAIWWFNTFVSPPLGELKHLGQMSRTNKTCKFNFNTPERNLQVYGQIKPPCYDFGRIKSKNLFFYVGNEDRLVSIKDIKATLAQLSVDYKMEFINETGVYFNHLGYITSKRNSRLVVVPTLKNIGTVEAQLDNEQRGDRR